MKKLKLLLLAIVAITAASCDDDDGPGVQFNNENIIGNFEITSFETIDTQIFTLNSTTVTEVITTIGDTFTNTTLSFNTNGTYSITGSYRVREVTRVDGAITDTDAYITTLGESGSYNIDEGNNTIVIDPGASAVFLNVSRFSLNGMTLIEDIEFADGSFFSEMTLVRL